MDKERIFEEIDRLLFEECWLIDIFPRQISGRRSREYFLLEEHFSRDEEIVQIGHKFLNVILKLYAYYEFDRVIDSDEKLLEDLDSIVDEIEYCMESGDGSVTVLMNGGRSLLQLFGDSLYMCLYAPDDDMKDIAGMLARSEGLFFRLAPDFEKEAEADE